jgi:hypothetical protein
LPLVGEFQAKGAPSVGNIIVNANALISSTALQTALWNCPTGHANPGSGMDISAKAGVTPSPSEISDR